MIETMKVAPGVGLAAPQIGVPLRLAVIEVDDKITVIINPEIVKTQRRGRARRRLPVGAGLLGSVNRAEKSLGQSPRSPRQGAAHPRRRGPVRPGPAARDRPSRRPPVHRPHGVARQAPARPSRCANARPTRRRAPPRAGPATKTRTTSRADDRTSRPLSRPDHRAAPRRPSSPYLQHARDLSARRSKRRRVAGADPAARGRAALDELLGGWTRSCSRAAGRRSGRYGEARAAAHRSQCPSWTSSSWPWPAGLLARELPTLGICRGQQLLNVALGGSLIQHLDDHRQPGDRSDLTHTINVAAGLAPGRRSWATRRSRSTRTHHQAVDATWRRD